MINTLEIIHTMINLNHPSFIFLTIGSIIMNDADISRMQGNKSYVINFRKGKDFMYNFNVYALLNIPKMTANTLNR